MLIETGFFSTPLNMFDIIYELQLKGYILVLAHPERYTYLQNNNKLLQKLKELNIKFQLNLLSATGYYGKKF